MTRRLHAALVWLHRWVGLTVGLVFAIVSLSGTVLLFQSTFFTWAHGDLIPAGLSAEAGSIDRWVEQARAAVPDLGDPIAIWMPHVEHNISDAAMLVFAGREPGGLGNMGFAGVLVAPATGDVLGVIDIDRSPAYAPLFLHRDLLAGQMGRVLSAVMAIGSLILLGVGLYLWWPARTPLLLRKLSPRPWRATFLRARPLHDWVGVWMLPVLFVLTATGLYLVQPAWVEPALDAIAGAPVELEPPAGVCEAPLGFDGAVARARTLLPSTATLKGIYPTIGATSRWEMTFATDGSDALQHETHVLADMACGTVVVEATPDTRSARDAAELWISGLHDGSAFGTLGKVVVSLAGLTPVVLAWSGVLMWLRRQRPIRRSSSSIVRGQSSFSSRDRLRSASSLPPV